jgi:hypothetical protein
MTSSLCSRAALGSLNAAVSTSLANSGSSNLQTPCPGFQFRTQLGVIEFHGQNAGELTWFPSFQLLVTNC